jgi:hypothetical protein
LAASLGSCGVLRLLLLVHRLPLHLGTALA